MERDRTLCKGGNKQAQWISDCSLERRNKGERFIRDRVGRSQSICVP